jgi:mannose-6-phosphate isomerase-like protein (cupin superfamily)
MKLQGIAKLARTTDAYRKVMRTGRRLQVVILTIHANESTGEEIHAASDRLLIVLHGDGEGLLGGTRHDLEKGDALFVAAGTRLTLRNTGKDELKLLDVFSPPVFPENLVQETREGRKPAVS